jgi:hypothetical protein
MKKRKEKKIVIKPSTVTGFSLPKINNLRNIFNKLILNTLLLIRIQAI